MHAVDARGDGHGDEEGLLERLRAGEEQAYEELVAAQTGRLLAVARRLLRSEEDARDAVQEAFLSAFRSIAGFAGGSRISTWLHRIAVNAALMKLRSKRSRPEQPIEELMPKFLEDGHHVAPPAPWPESTDAMLERDETRRQVRAAIERLPEDYRNVVMLRDIEELSTREAAQVLGISPNAVKVRLHRARQALRALLDRELRETRT